MHALAEDLLLEIYNSLQRPEKFGLAKDYRIAAITILDVTLGLNAYTSRRGNLQIPFSSNISNIISRTCVPFSVASIIMLLGPCRNYTDTYETRHQPIYPLCERLMNARKLQWFP